VRASAAFAPCAALAVVAACGAATDPSFIEVPGAGGDASTPDSAAATSADATSAMVDAREASALPEGSDAKGSEGGEKDEGGTGATCVPIAVTDVPSSGGPACASTGACFPHDETSFSPTWVPPLPQSNSCTASQIDDFYTVCLGPGATDDACGTWTGASANASCGGCLKTQSTAKAYGALIEFPGNVVELNEAGCVALAESCNLPCAKTWLASIECREAACTSTYCPVQSDQISCAMTAAACSACEGYEKAADCMMDLEGPGHLAGEWCAIGATDNGPTQTDYTSLATFMCGM